ncbi:MAG: sigma-70 family RNA polymerase sigma factor [Pseudomonadota bacterium]
MIGEEDKIDDRLMAAAGRGDEQAFNRLLQRHSSRVHAVVMRYVQRTDYADEIVQDAFWKAWQASAGWKPGRAKFSTWLYRVAVNRAIDYLRNNRRYEDVDVDDVSDTAVQADEFDNHQILSEVLSAIEQLPDRQRLALVLSVQEAKTNAEIAHIMDCSHGSVEQLLVRARRSLRKKLRDLT